MTCAASTPPTGTSNRAKRGGQAQQVSLSNIAIKESDKSPDLIRLDEALNELAKVDPQKSRIIEMGYFGGLTDEEIAEVLGVSVVTVRRHWKFAKAWLRREVER